MPGGRPEKYSEELAEKILDDMKEGLSLPDACKKHGIERKTFRNWYCKRPELLLALTHAREERCWTRFENLRAVAYDESRDYYVDDKGIRRSDNTSVQRDRLKLDEEWRQLRAIIPKVFSEKFQTEVSGKDGAPLAVVVNVSQKTKDD